MDSFWHHYVVLNTHLNACTNTSQHKHVSCFVVVSFKIRHVVQRRFCLDKHLCLVEKLSSIRAQPSQKDLSYRIERENKRGELLYVIKGVSEQSEYANNAWPMNRLLAFNSCCIAQLSDNKCAFKTGSNRYDK